MADVELLPLPEWTKRDDLGGLVPSEVRAEMQAYARANVAHATAAQAENERLRAEVMRLECVTCELMDANTRADDLAEALRELVDVFSESGMYDEEVFAKARSVLAANVTSKEN